MSDKWEIKLGGKTYSSSDVSKIKQVLVKLKGANNLPDNILVLPPGKEAWLSIREVDELKDIFQVAKKVSPEPARKARPEPVIEKKANDGIKCPKCGYENGANAEYCGMCSAPLKKREKGPAETAPAVARPVRVKTKKRINITPLVVLLIIGFGLYKFFGGTGETGPSAEKKSSAEIKFEANIDNIISNGGDLNKKDDRGHPLILWAVSYNYNDALQKLLANGVNPDSTPGGGAKWPVLFEAITPKFRISGPAYPAKSLKTTQLLLENGADVNFVSPSGIGETAIYKAANCGRDDMCKLFIENGADVNVVDKLGQTPLMEAAKGGYWETVQVLIDNGADVNAVSQMGETALGIAKKEQKEHTDKPVTGENFSKTIEILESSN